MFRGPLPAEDCAGRALLPAGAPAFRAVDERSAAGAPGWRGRLLPAIALALSIAAHAGDRPDCATALSDDLGLATARQTLRIVDCARCHGKHYTGLAAPSIVDYVRTQGCEQFDHIVLVGDPPRGMPGYRSNLLIADTIDDLYRYFRSRAEGRLCADARPPASTWSTGDPGTPGGSGLPGRSRSRSGMPPTWPRGGDDGKTERDQPGRRRQRHRVRRVGDDERTGADDIGAKGGVAVGGEGADAVLVVEHIGQRRIGHEGGAEAALTLEVEQVVVDDRCGGGAAEDGQGRGGDQPGQALDDPG